MSLHLTSPPLPTLPSYPLPLPASHTPVHPDFFTQYPRERSINSENLKWLNNYLDSTSVFSSSSSSSSSSSFGAGSGASPRDLVFYVKTTSSTAPSFPASSPSSSTSSASPFSPSRVVVPLNGRVFHSLHTILSSHCQLGASLPPPLPSPSPSPSFPSSSYHDDIDDSSDAFSRARARGQAHWGPARQRQEEEVEDARPAPFLDRFLQSVLRRQKHQEREEGGGGEKEEGGSSLLRRRQEAAQDMEATIARLRAKWGFESVQVQRCVRASLRVWVEVRWWGGVVKQWSLPSFFGFFPFFAAV